MPSAALKQVTIIQQRFMFQSTVFQKYALVLREFSRKIFKVSLSHDLTQSPISEYSTRRPPSLKNISNTLLPDNAQAPSAFHTLDLFTSAAVIGQQYDRVLGCEVIDGVGRAVYCQVSFVIQLRWHRMSASHFTLAAVGSVNGV